MVKNAGDQISKLESMVSQTNATSLARTRKFVEVSLLIQFTELSIPRINFVVPISLSMKLIPEEGF